MKVTTNKLLKKDELVVTHGNVSHGVNAKCWVCDRIKEKYPLNTFKGETQNELVVLFKAEYESGWDDAVANLEGIHKREIKAEHKRFIDKINSYSSASSRASNSFEHGVSAGIEMFREYLLSDKKRIVKKGKDE